MRITYYEALRGLIDAVKLKGEDYVYGEELEMCSYVRHDGPSCIVGHLMINTLGVDPLSIRKYEGTDAGYAMASLGFEMDDDTMNLLTEVQRMQDLGTPWGEAVQVAVEYVNRQKSEQ
jgi:hypothetical protein